MEILEDIAKEAIKYNTGSSGEELTKIEGIGPKTAALLNEKGLRTFADLASASSGDLEAILDAGGSSFNLADPTTWPEQAQLAADGQWEELERLQEELLGGRR